MQLLRADLVFQSSPIYILVCVLVGVALALILYFRSKEFSARKRAFLAVLRGLLGFLVAFLLFNPLLKTLKNIVLKPKVVALVDNSKSMLFGGDAQIEQLKKSLSNLKSEILAKGFDFEAVDLSNQHVDIENLTKSFFTNNKTNFSTVFSDIKSNNDGQNLQELILVSDGLLNEGVSPTNATHSFSISTVGYGDTTLRKDAIISGVSGNKLVYLNNKFTVNADIYGKLLAGKAGKVTVRNSGGKVLDSKNISFKTSDDFQTTSFEILADKIGKMRLLIDIVPIDGEFSTKNNHRELIVDVVDGKEKILLLAAAPHPDIKAIKSMADKSALFQMDVFIANSSNIQSVVVDNYDVVILHQLPNTNQIAQGLLNTIMTKNKPVFYVLGSKSNFGVFNGMQNVVGINQRSMQFDKVNGVLNTSFSLFTMDENTQQTLEKLPPISVPFGEYALMPGSEVIFFQKVGAITTPRPFLAININSNKKNAVWVGDGLWQWRLEEFASTEQHAKIDELFLKTLQLISVKEDKSKLRVYPIADVFDINQKITFVAEAYNKIFEPIYNQTITLKIKDEKGVEKRYGFTTTPENSRFEINNLPAGVYNYTANSIVLGKNETTSGQFVVTETDIEMLNPTADFSVLKTIAAENNGVFVNISNVGSLINKLNTKSITEKIISNEEFKDLINLRWLLALIIALATAEWVARKYFGSY